MYWAVGEYLSTESKKTTLGDKYIDTTAKEIQNMFPGIKEFNHMVYCDSIRKIRRWNMDSLTSRDYYFEVGVKYMRMWEEIVDAKAEGKRLNKIEQVRKSLAKGRSLEVISDFMEEKIETIEMIRDAIEENPALDDEEILEQIKELWQD